VGVRRAACPHEDAALALTGGVGGRGGGSLASNKLTDASAAALAAIILKTTKLEGLQYVQRARFISLSLSVCLYLPICMGLRGGALG
jgi:hypothetical protein